MACVLDTDAYTYLNRGAVRASEIVRAAERIYLPAPVMAELRYGFLLGSKTQENETQLKKFIAASQVLVIYADEATIDVYAALAAFARKRGKQLSNNDIWIASLAWQYNATLLTYDNDFLGITGFEGLQLNVLKSNSDIQ